MQRVGRPFNSFTPLGKMMLDAGLSAHDVAYATGIYPRTLSDYLSWRVPIRRQHLVRLCALFECEPEAFVPRCHYCGDRGCVACK